LTAAQQGETSFIDAIAILRAEVAEYPLDAHRREWLALACVGAEQYADALVAADDAIALDPDRADAYWVRSSALGKAGRVDEARLAAERAVTLAPDDVLNWTRLVYACLEVHDDAATLAAAAELERRAPFDITPCLVRAMIHEAHGLWEECASELAQGWSRQPTDARWPVLLAGVRWRQHEYASSAAAAEHAWELDTAGTHTAPLSHILVRARTRLSYRIPIWRRLPVAARAGAGVVAFALVALMSSVRIALLASLVPVLAYFTYMFVQSRALPRAARREQRPGLGIGSIATVAYAVAIGAAVGATFGYLWVGALAVPFGCATVLLAALARHLRRRRRWEACVIAAAVAHDHHDCATQWHEAEKLRVLDEEHAYTHWEYVHALAHHDVDAAMIPLDALLNKAAPAPLELDAMHCAAQAVSWALLVRGHVGGGLAWARRAVALAPDRPQGQYALALAEHGALDESREALQRLGVVSGMSPAAVAADLRARAIAHALLGADTEASTTIEGARAFDGSGEEFVYAIRRVGEILDARNDEAV
jgi:tetratricopeptide (TPR) repeat protein